MRKQRRLDLCRVGFGWLAAVERNGGGQIRTHPHRKLIGDAAAETETDNSDLAVTVRARFQPRYLVPFVVLLWSPMTAIGVSSPMVPWRMRCVWRLSPGRGRLGVARVDVRDRRVHAAIVTAPHDRTVNNLIDQPPHIVSSRSWQKLDVLGHTAAIITVVVDCVFQVAQSSIP